MLADRRYFPMDGGVPIVSFALALPFSTASLISLGFLIASLVPTARFAQPIGTGTARGGRATPVTSSCSG